MLLPLAVSTALLSCAVHPKGEFDAATAPPAPDYSRLENWAAHPGKQDPADQTPTPQLTDNQSDAGVDVLFFHPTTYTGTQRHEKHWNADVRDAKTNKKTDNSTILFQASLFNGTGKVYAPRYRQAHLDVFFNRKKRDSDQKALALAYSDIEAAFDYYLKNWNQGRPFIIAGHSQGALHAMNLIKQKIEGTPLESQLVAAYIVGWPVKKDFFKHLKPCEKPDQTDCFCSWRTWNRDYVLDKKDHPGLSPDIVCTNPLLWNTQAGVYAPKADNKGAVIRPFHKIYPHSTDAEVYNGLLLARKPKFKGSFLFRRKNYHIGDLNLYYLNVRENAQLRAGAYFRK